MYLIFSTNFSHLYRESQRIYGGRAPSSTKKISMFSLGGKTKLEAKTEHRHLEPNIEPNERVH